ncbi:hypothetical protein D9M68_512060 [compost metagenome]
MKRGRCHAIVDRLHSGVPAHVTGAFRNADTPSRHMPKRRPAQRGHCACRRGRHTCRLRHRAGPRAAQRRRQPQPDAASRSQPLGTGALAAGRRHAARHPAWRQRRAHHLRVQRWHRCRAGHGQRHQRLQPLYRQLRQDGYRRAFRPRRRHAHGLPAAAHGTGVGVAQGDAGVVYHRRHAAVGGQHRTAGYLEDRQR